MAGPNQVRCRSFDPEDVPCVASIKPLVDLTLLRVSQTAFHKGSRSCDGGVYTQV